VRRDILIEEYTIRVKGADICKSVSYNDYSMAILIICITVMGMTTYETNTLYKSGC
jgi:hypothetical protein